MGREAAEQLLAIHLGLRHSPVCRELNDRENQMKGRLFRSTTYTCHCDFYEKLEKGTRDLLRRGANATTQEDHEDDTQG